MQDRASGGEEALYILKQIAGGNKLSALISESLRTASSIARSDSYILNLTDVVPFKKTIFPERRIPKGAAVRDNAHADVLSGPPLRTVFAPSGADRRYVFC